MKITDQLVNKNVNFVNNGSTDQRINELVPTTAKEPAEPGSGKAVCRCDK